MAFVGRGFFCVIEGIDGSGKSTLVRQLRSRFASSEGDTRHIARAFSNVIFSREPTSEGPGAELRRALAERRELTREQWLHLFFSDRDKNVHTNIRPALQRGALVIQDRYFYSTAAYQGHAEGPTPTAIIQRSLAQGFPRPDLLVFLEIDPASALERIEQGRDGKETFETLDQLKNIDQAYREILPPETIRLDASRSPEDLAEHILHALHATLLQRTNA